MCRNGRIQAQSQSRARERREAGGSHAASCRTASAPHHTRLHCNRGTAAHTRESCGSAREQQVQSVPWIDRHGGPKRHHLKRLRDPLNIALGLTLSPARGATPATESRAYVPSLLAHGPALGTATRPPSGTPLGLLSHMCPCCEAQRPPGLRSSRTLLPSPRLGKLLSQNC